MKKLILLIIIFTLGCTDIQIESAKVNASESYPNYYIRSLDRGLNGNTNLSVTIYIKDDIEYRIFTNTGYNATSVFVVNHTKELLEVELLKKQLTH